MISKIRFHGGIDSGSFPTSSTGNFPFAISAASLNISNMAEGTQNLRDKVQSRLDELGINPFEAARRGELERGFINDILQGKKRSVRGENLRKLATALDLSMADLIDEKPRPPRPPAATLPDRQSLPIQNEVAAGVWLARDDTYQAPPVLDTFQAVSDPRFASIRQWLERVRGDSFNQKVPDGALVHVVDAIGLHYQPRHGDTVIVERSRAEGQFVERTLKQIEISSNAIQLWPRSHNPRWSEPMAYTNGLRSGEFDEVRIVGLVIQAYINFEGI